MPALDDVSFIPFDLIFIEFHSNDSHFDFGTYICLRISSIALFIIEIDTFIYV